MVWAHSAGCNAHWGDAMRKLIIIGLILGIFAIIRLSNGVQLVVYLDKKESKHPERWARKMLKKGFCTEDPIYVDGEAFYSCYDVSEVHMVRE